MDKEILAGEVAAKVAAALRKKEDENDHLKNVLQAFGKLRIEQARWKALLPVRNGSDITLLDPEKFSEGVPLADRERLICLGDLWRTAAERLIPPMAEGFPKVSRELARLETAIRNSTFHPDLFLGAHFGGRDEEARGIAAELGLEVEFVLFALHQMAKPVVENCAASILPMVGELAWNRGYCPICGSFPEMSLLREKEGQRWLLCSFCGTTWRFSRTSCPFCDTQGPEHRERFFVEGREHEAAEVCHKCGKYLTSIDLRNMADQIVQEIMDISLMHLDVVALQKGFLPMKGIGWASA
jgi:FdhE protein